MNPDERRKESQSIIVKYPDRVPVLFFSSIFFLNQYYYYYCLYLFILLLLKVIIEKYSRTDLPELDKKKYVFILCFPFCIFPKLGSKFDFQFSFFEGDFPIMHFK